ncbi:MAG TPA: DUF3857 domain-containing protein [Candidatus Acidoferrales bacterium]|nr:DUF3857 domain-containing protein [Candidatus Acidoferrales bacterium]
MKSRLAGILLAAVVAYSSSVAVRAQQPPAQAPSSGSTKAAPPDYSKEAAVVEQARISFRFENDGSGVEDQYARIRIQGVQAVQNWGQLMFEYNASTDKIHVVFIRVTKPDGHVVTAGSDAVQDLSSPVERIAPVYTDIRQVHVTVPDLGVGDTLEYQIHTDSVQPIVPGQFFINWNANKTYITLDESFQANVPRDREIHIKTSNGIAPPKIEDQGDRRIYTWKSSFTKRPDDSGDTTKKTNKNRAPEIPDVQISTFASWQRVGQWYATLEAPRAAVTDAIRAKADELVKGQTTDLAKAKIIYDYVSKNIRYVSLSFGVGRYQPHPAADVLSNQYGDCKDKATLLEALLAAEKIQSYPVLINSSSKIDPDIPSPAQFDHLINIVVLDGKPVWVDSTPGVSPFGFLLPQLLDKKALAIPSATTSALEETPQNPPFMPELDLKLGGKVDSIGGFQGTLELSGTGEFAVVTRGVLRTVPQNYWQKVAENLLKELIAAQDPKVSDFHFTGVDDLDQPIAIDISFSTYNFIDLSKQDIAFSLPGHGIDLNDVDQPDEGSTDPLKLGVIHDETEFWRIIFPSQIKVALSVPIHVTRDYGEYESDYSLSGNTVMVERHLILRNAKLPSSRYNDFEAFRNAVTSDENQKLALTNSSPGSGAIPAEMSADDLYNAGFEAENSRNYAHAAQLFAAAGAKDPDHKNVWNALGHVYNEMRDYADAVPALQKAISKNPYDDFAYNNLGNSYEGLGRYDEAELQFQKQIEVNPLDRYAHANLAGLYLQQKKYEASQKEFQTALKITPNNFNLNVGLGSADLGLHQDDAALAAFHVALEKSPSPMTWNNVAFYLADNNSHLDIAQQYSENSIRAIEAQLNAASLGTVGPTQVGLVQVIATFWDTMGWIEFKQGNLTAAESYILSAWLIMDDASIGDHLGQIYEKQNRREDAIHAYALALTYPNPPVDTRGRLAKLVGESRADTAISFAHADQRREITIANPQKLDGSAEFWVLLTAGTPLQGSDGLSAEVGDVKFISVVSDPSKPADAKLTAALRNYSALLLKAKFPYHFPVTQATQLILRGVLACSSATNSCTFDPLPGDQAILATVASSSQLQ